MVVSILLMSKRTPSYLISFLEIREIFEPMSGGSILVVCMATGHDKRGYKMSGDEK